MLKFDSWSFVDMAEDDFGTMVEGDAFLVDVTSSQITIDVANSRRITINGMFLADPPLITGIGLYSIVDPFAITPLFFLDWLQIPATEETLDSLDLFVNEVLFSGHDLITASGGFGSIMRGFDGQDRMSSTGSEVTLLGDEGNDRLITSGFNNYLVGGLGDDRYELNGALQGFVTLYEAPGQGIDEVWSAGSFVLPANIENLFLTSGSFDGSGNSQANWIVGTDGTNVLRGFGGNDLLEGGAGSDTLDGGVGDDHLVGSFVGSQAGLPLLPRGGPSLADDADNYRPWWGAGSVVVTMPNLGSSGDVFVIRSGEGNDTIWSFRGAPADPNAFPIFGYDIVRLEGFGFADFAAVRAAMTQVGDDVRLDLGAGQFLTFKSVALADLNTRNFEFGALSTPLAPAEIEGPLLWSGSTDAFGALGGNNAPNTIRGSAVADRIFGRGGGDFLDGGLGVDWMEGGLGDDTYFIESLGDIAFEHTGEGSGDNVRVSIPVYSMPYEIENLRFTGAGDFVGIGNSWSNFMVGSIGNDVLIGDTGNDTLIGDLGNDTLDGSSGADVMNAGAGTDVYFVDDAGDRIFEAADSGYDTILAWIGVDLSVLAPNVEVAGLLGNASMNITGNTLANVFFCNDGVNEAHGGFGNDVIVGYAGNDFLWGEDGDDTLDGSLGADQLQGGTGVDVYLIDNIGDMVFEELNQGSDVALSFINYDLGLNSNVEKLSLLGSSHIFGIGNELDNELYGNSGNNNLDAQAGNDAVLGFGGDDALWGRSGDDRLYGHDGNDVFRGGTGLDLMEGGSGNDIFTLRLGEVQGDLIVDFTGNGAALGDILHIEGYSAANLVNAGGDSWSINHSGGSETFRMVGVTSLHSSDFVIFAS